MQKVNKGEQFVVILLTVTAVGMFCGFTVGAIATDMHNSTFGWLDTLVGTVLGLVVGAIIGLLLPAQPRRYQ
ncbi:MAG: hypothetical protein M0Z27_02580 [Thermaerobacter sp.]|nr:hypothetical protein [Thermaerobacter sp.]MDA8144936.1 hypothetical protein [Thermaerobacter sp.]